MAATCTQIAVYKKKNMQFYHRAAECSLSATHAQTCM